MEQKEVLIILVAIEALVVFFSNIRQTPSSSITGDYINIPPEESCECTSGSYPTYAGNGWCFVCVEGDCIRSSTDPYPAQNDGTLRRVLCASWDAHQARLSEASRAKSAL